MAMYKCNPASLFAMTLFLLAILHLQTLPYQNRVVAIFPLACMAAISNSLGSKNIRKSPILDIAPYTNIVIIV